MRVTKLAQTQSQAAGSVRSLHSSLTAARLRHVLRLAALLYERCCSTERVLSVSFWLLPQKENGLFELQFVPQLDAWRTPHSDDVLNSLTFFSFSRAPLYLRDVKIGLLRNTTEVRRRLVC